MNKDLIFEDKNLVPNAFENLLEETLREGAKKILRQAIENEVEEYLEKFKTYKDEHGRRTVVRNGYLPERSIQTGIGPISIEQPRVRDKEKKNIFKSVILPPYMRRTALQKLLKINQT